MVKHVMKMTLNDATNSDLDIFYYGGTGGFYLLHQLLLTEKFYCNFGDENKSFLDINDSQFNISEIKFWKNTEIWPDNDLTKTYQTSLRKIYFYCNDCADWINAKEYKICLYTDYKSHIRLAANKRAYFYTKGHLYNNNYIEHTKKLLKNYNSEIYKKYKIAMKKSDLNVRTQDVWTVDGLENFLNKVGCEIQQVNIDFLKRFLNLHPKKLLEKIGVNNEMV